MTRAPCVIKRARVIASTPLGFRRTYHTYSRPTWGCACGGANEASRIATRGLLNGVSYPPGLSRTHHNVRRCGLKAHNLTRGALALVRKVYRDDFAV